ncbi:G-protein coupled receptor 35 isoform X3 [Canis lupus familiaris]|uniref:G-protein coupled receptor 35 isoform X3 n=1 Tax=Canis lupus familiaris TaxID=9615 RepID=UPI0018F5AAD4|nr:G-protein coupled receptor 35 isoform X3 [Canis lupus familiaris]
MTSRRFPTGGGAGGPSNAGRQLVRQGQTVLRCTCNLRFSLPGRPASSRTSSLSASRGSFPVSTPSCPAPRTRAAGHSPVTCRPGELLLLAAHSQPSAPGRRQQVGQRPPEGEGPGPHAGPGPPSLPREPRDPGWVAPAGSIRGVRPSVGPGEGPAARSEPQAEKGEGRLVGKGASARSAGVGSAWEEPVTRGGRSSGPAPPPPLPSVSQRARAAGEAGRQPLEEPAQGQATEAMSANGTCARPHPTWVENVDRTYTGALLVLGLLLNGLALWVLCCRMRPWTETRVYMVNLAAADLCLLCALPFFLHSLKDTTDTVSCQLSQGIYLANRYLSIGLITAIAVDRYVAVRHPLCARGLRSPRQAAAVCAALWVLVGSSLVLRWALGVQEGGFCFRNPARQSAGTTLFSLLGFYPPLAVLGFCSLQVVAALAERPASGPHQAQATRRATRMVWANLAVFVLCFLPFHVVLTVYAAAGRPTPALCYALYVTGKLSDANCCLDAIGYYFVAKEFQEATLLASVPVAKAHRTQDSLSVTLA